MIRTLIATGAVVAAMSGTAAAFCSQGSLEVDEISAESMYCEPDHYVVIEVDADGSSYLRLNASVSGGSICADEGSSHLVCEISCNAGGNVRMQLTNIGSSYTSGQTCVSMFLAD